MAYVVKDRVKVTSTTTGTGTFTLGSAVDGYQDFSAIGDGNQTYYTITNGTDWEVGIGTYTSSGTTLSRDTIFESSNSNAAVNWGAGSKEVFVTFPAENTQGTVPTGDNGSVGTDLTAWNNLKKTLDAGVVNGVPYANSGTNGVVSTVGPLLATFHLGYSGGVLNANNELHFVPFQDTSGNRGQKINTVTGVVSTYSLVYSTNVSAFNYQGGCLAPNGDIHFIPRNAAVGQKVSASGVVSTYSLVYTSGSNPYIGGGVDANGNIHFTPFVTSGAAVGQKVSPAGVVSTYSLVYTTTSMYIGGGVLAPNGDLHFPPYNARVGQKVSAAGVVSTYSLAYTTTNAYVGGVLNPNGEIHFVPSNAQVGQKISVNGTVSTYSLVYTTTGAYSGGVLAPNGDVVFTPVGTNTTWQKVSVNGAVSTYASQFSTDDIAALMCSITPTGDVYYFSNWNVSGSSPRIQKVSYGVGTQPGFSISPFFNRSF